MTYYKVLEKDGSNLTGPGRWVPGEWRSVEGELVPCENGLHLARREDLVSWLGPAIWTAEADESEILVSDDQVVVRRARILDRITAWDERTARLFAADCAERVLPIYENVCDDPHPREAIETSRRYAEGEATKKELGAAYRAAVRVPDATDLAPLSAAYWAYGAVERAANSVTSAVYLAKHSAYAAAEAADDPKSERSWQTERLFAYLEGGVV